MVGSFASVQISIYSSKALTLGNDQKARMRNTDSKNVVTKHYNIHGVKPETTKRADGADTVTMYTAYNYSLHSFSQEQLSITKAFQFLIHTSSYFSY